MPESSAPAVDGWFTTDPEPHLVGLRCTACGTLVFPPRALACPNPDCTGTTLEPTPLSRRGRVWSYTTNHYAPPEPYVVPDPFVPYTVVAAELDDGLTILGQLADDADAADLSIGADVAVAVGPLADGALVWKWRPVVRA